MDSPWFLTVAIIVIILQAFTLFLAFFEPALPYKIRKPFPDALDSDRFIRILALLSGSTVYRNTRIEHLPNGEVFYEAELEAIRTAKRCITLEAYIFQKGKITRQFLAALTERARAGVKINLVLDAIGCFTSWDSYFRELTAAGGQVQWYHGFRWNELPRLNHRTHRELLIVDCEIGFIGGAGFADHWRY